MKIQVNQVPHYMNEKGVFRDLIFDVEHEGVTNKDDRGNKKVCFLITAPNGSPTVLYENEVSVINN